MSSLLNSSRVTILLTVQQKLEYYVNNIFNNRSDEEEEKCTEQITAENLEFPM